MSDSTTLGMGIGVGVLIIGLGATIEYLRLKSEKEIINAEQAYSKREIREAYSIADCIKQQAILKRSIKQRAKNITNKIENEFSETILNEIEENMKKVPRKMQVDLRLNSCYFPNDSRELSKLSPTYAKYFHKN